MKLSTLLAAASLVLAGHLASAAPTANLVVDSEKSSVTFDVRATLHSFTGTAGGAKLEATFSPESGQPVSAVFTAPVASMTTNHKKRDHEMLEWLEAEAYPEIRFELTSFERDPEGTVAVGAMSIHGVTREIKVPVRLTHDGTGSVTIDGEITIDDRDYDLEQIRKFGLLTVNPEVTVHFHFVGSLQS